MLQLPWRCFYCQYKPLDNCKFCGKRDSHDKRLKKQFPYFLLILQNHKHFTDSSLQWEPCFVQYITI